MSQVVWVNYLTDSDVKLNRKILYAMCVDNDLDEFMEPQVRIQMYERFKQTFGGEPIQTDWRKV